MEKASDEQMETDEWDQAEAELVVPSKSKAIDLASVHYYTILTSQQIETKMQTLIHDSSEMLSLPADTVTILLIYYKWNWEKLQTEWFANEEKVRKSCGLPLSGSIQKALAPSQCPICFSDITSANSDSLACGHTFCASCWAGHLQSQLAAAKACLLARCPEEGCSLRVGPSLFKKHLPAADFSKYQKYLLITFTDDNRSVRWCPRPGCGLLVENAGPKSIEVSCKCEYVFCFDCMAEGHLPVDCETNKKWFDKHTAESGNVNWMKANTKPCPKCKLPIEKNQGCNHMTCSQCRYEFCWICMGDWIAHKGNYNCNAINKELLVSQEDAKTQLQKYIFYVERYENHRKAMAKAEEQKPLIAEFALLLNQTRGIDFIDTQFLYEALDTLKNTRRVLSNSYIFGYYLKNVKEVRLFEFLQQDLEFNCERLHEMVERKKDEFFDPDEVSNCPFFKYKSELMDLCGVIKKFYERFIDGIKVGLASGNY